MPSSRIIPRKFFRSSLSSSGTALLQAGKATPWSNPFWLTNVHLPHYPRFGTLAAARSAAGTQWLFAPSGFVQLSLQTRRHAHLLHSVGVGKKRGRCGG